MFKNTTPQWWLGLLIGLVLPVIGIFIITSSRPELVGVQRFGGEIIKQLNVMIITFGMLINAGAFFVFLRLEKEDISRGILFISVIYLVAIFIYRFLL